MQIAILSGSTTDGGPDIRPSYPRNMVPVVQESGISKGYLRPADGIVHLVEGPGKDRGGITWNGQHIRVMGGDLVRVNDDATLTKVGSIPGVDQVTMDYSANRISNGIIPALPGRLAIAAANLLFYWDGSVVSQVVDPDLGACKSITWIDGYFVSTDGDSIVVLDLADPYSVEKLKYGSAEKDPDPIYKVVRVQGELCAIGRYTIEYFDTIATEGFPFQRVEGAMIPKGAIGSHAACVFGQAVAFVGGGRNEPVSVYLGLNATAQRISTDEVDKALNAIPAPLLQFVVIEATTGADQNRIYVHLPDRTMVYDQSTSQAAGEPIWTTLSSSVEGLKPYRARNFIWQNGRWVVGDPEGRRLGYLDPTTGHHWGELVTWEFDTSIIYNEGRGAIVHELELVTLAGRVDLGADPVVETMWSPDGRVWSQPRAIRAGGRGETLRRLRWLMQGMLSYWRIQRFRGTSAAHCSFARLEATIEPLAV